MGGSGSAPLALAGSPGPLDDWGWDLFETPIVNPPIGNSPSGILASALTILEEPLRIAAYASGEWVCVNQPTRVYIDDDAIDTANSDSDVMLEAISFPPCGAHFYT